MALTTDSLNRIDTVNFQICAQLPSTSANNTPWRKHNFLSEKLDICRQKNATELLLDITQKSQNKMNKNLRLTKM